MAIESGKYCQNLVALLKGTIELKQDARRELEPHLAVYYLLKALRVVLEMPYRRLLQRIVAENRHANGRVAQVFAALHVRNGYQPRLNGIALHHRMHRLGDYALQEAVDPL